MHPYISAIAFPAMFVWAWYLTLSGSVPPGADLSNDWHLKATNWLLYFSGFAFLSGAVMHSLFAKTTARSIGWVTNGFQYEIAAVSFGLGLACFFVLDKGTPAKISVAIPIICFLFLAGINHLKEIFIQRNFAPNNVLILIWDFGVSVSLAILLLPYLQVR